MHLILDITPLTLALVAVFGDGVRRQTRVRDQWMSEYLNATVPASRS